MPALDGTGPMGMGPLTGGGRGWCNPYFYGIRPSLWGFPAYQPWAWQGIPYGLGRGFLRPYWPGNFMVFPYRFFGRGRGLRRWW